MKTYLQVLTEDERAQVHERTIKILEETGIWVETEKGRDIFKKAGAEVDETEELVRIPRALVEESLKLAPKIFSLGARRPDCDLHMNSGNCTLLIDGEAMHVIDRKTGERRLGTFDDWLDATRLADALDEIGVYWKMLESGGGHDTQAEMVAYWRNLVGNFSKHIQDSIVRPEQAPWLLGVLQVVFGDKRTIRRQHPISFLICPRSPLTLEGLPTDALLQLVDWDIPVAIMPMPLMGATAPGSLISTIILGNCEVLAMTCLLQAAAPGIPVIYAPALAVIDPRSGRYGGGPIEHGLLGAATTEMARFYGLPVEASGLGSDHNLPGIQSSYERAMNGLLPTLARPDILVGPGLLGGSMTVSFEQLYIDVEIFRMFQRAHTGIDSSEEAWLDNVIDKVGPGGNFLGERSTVKSVRQGRWYISELGVHEPYESWANSGKPRLLEEVREEIDTILKEHQPLPLDEEVERELDRIEKKAKMTES